ncbi:hypothetical protein U737_09710 [Methylomonas sp. LW13]|nr:hypothetical protein U737_09710 [Methylomonas sp. LW13]
MVASHLIGNLPLSANHFLADWLITWATAHQHNSTGKPQKIELNIKLFNINYIHKTPAFYG